MTTARASREHKLRNLKEVLTSAVRILSSLIEGEPEGLPPVTTRVSTSDRLPEGMPLPRTIRRMGATTLAEVADIDMGELLKRLDIDKGKESHPGEAAGVITLAKMLHAKGLSVFKDDAGKRLLAHKGDLLLGDRNVPVNGRFVSRLNKLGLLTVAEAKAWLLQPNNLTPPEGMSPDNWMEQCSLLMRFKLKSSGLSKTSIGDGKKKVRNLVKVSTRPATTAKSTRGGRAIRISFEEALKIWNMCQGSAVNLKDVVAKTGRSDFLVRKIRSEAWFTPAERARLPRAANSTTTPTSPSADKGKTVQASNTSNHAGIGQSTDLFDVVPGMDIKVAIQLLAAWKNGASFQSMRLLATRLGYFDPLGDATLTGLSKGLWVTPEMRQEVETAVENYTAPMPLGERTRRPDTSSTTKLGKVVQEAFDNGVGSNLPTSSREASRLTQTT